MPAYDVFLSKVLIQTPGCPDITVLETARDVVRDFCSETHIWQEWGDIYLDSSIDVYDLVPPAKSEIITVSRLVRDNRDISPVTSSMPGIDVNFEGAVKGSINRGWHFEPPDSVRFAALPSEQGIVYARMVLMPEADADSFPDWLWQKYQEGLVSGVFAKLFIQHGMKWSNPGLAQLYLRDYNKKIGRAKVNLVKAHTNASLRVKARRFV